MTCDELLTYLSRYLDQELDDDLTRAAQLHLATCEHCQVILNTTQQVIILGHDQSQRVIPRERRARLFERLQDAFLRHAPQSDGALGG